MGNTTNYNLPTNTDNELKSKYQNVGQWRNAIDGTGSDSLVKKIDEALKTVEGKIPDVTGFATKGEIPNVSNLATKSELNAKADTSDVPTKTSDLTNDSGFTAVTPNPTIPDGTEATPLESLKIGENYYSAGGSGGGNGKYLHELYVYNDDGANPKSNKCVFLRIINDSQVAFTETTLSTYYANNTDFIGDINYNYGLTFSYGTFLSNWWSFTSVAGSAFRLTTYSKDSIIADSRYKNVVDKVTPL